MYGKHMIGDIYYGKNVLSIDWYNQQFIKNKKKLLTEDNWMDFIMCLKDFIDADGESGFMREVDFQTVIFFKSYNQYKYFYYLIMKAQY